MSEIEDQVNEIENVVFSDEKFSTETLLNEETKVSEEKKETKIDIKDEPKSESALEISSLLVNVYSEILAFSCAKISGDVSTSAYSLSSTRKEIIVEPLSKILDEQKNKISLPLLLFISIVTATSPSIVLALNNRKNFKTKKNFSEPVINSTSEVTKDENVFSTPQRKRGRPSKQKPI